MGKRYGKLSMEGLRNLEEHLLNLESLTCWMIKSGYGAPGEYQRARKADLSRLGSVQSRIAELGGTPEPWPGMRRRKGI